MTREERHIAVLNRMIESMDVYDSIQPTTERKKAIKAAIQALSQESNRDMEEIAEIMKSDADAETKCKMISNILTAKPHYFEKQEPTIQDKQAESEKYQKAFDDGYANGYAQARFDYKQESCTDAQERYEDLCEYFGDAKDILKSREDFKAWLERVKWHIRKAEELFEKYEYKQEPCDDAISRQAAIDAMYALCDIGETLKENQWRDNPHIDAVIDALDNLPPVTQKPKTVPIAVIRFDDDKLHEIVEEAVKNIEIEPKWIPVSERLPEDGTYLVTVERIDGEPRIDMESFAKDLNKVDEFDFPKHKCGWYDYDSEYGYWEDNKVIAWMPLPEPY